MAIGLREKIMFSLIRVGLSEPEANLGNKGSEKRITRTLVINAKKFKIVVYPNLRKFYQLRLNTTA